ncbi:MAG: hypothetical protein ABI718_07480 [Acidobacteriota bacterium]
MRTLRVILLALTIGSLTSLVSAQETKSMPQDQMKMERMKEEMKPDAMGGMDCKAMMQMHEDMQKKMQGMDAKVDQLVADMNAASGSKKVDRMAAVIGELVAQRKQMREQMQSMMPMMMQHMMQHMQAGMMKGMTDSMSSCPMMKKEGTPAEAHEHRN